MPIELKPIESSMIEAAGYEPAIGLLRLKFRGGASYDYRPVSPEMFAAFEAAESKGRFVNSVLRSLGTEWKEEAVAGPLDMADPDPCCGRALSKALASGALDKTDTWTHERCGCRWGARRMEDGSRYWYPVVEVWII